MIMDALLLFDPPGTSGNGTPCSSWTNMPGNNDSANIIDVSQLPGSTKGLGRDIGVADGLVIVCQVNTSYSTGSSPTLQVSLQTAPDNGSGSPGTWTTLEQTPALAASGLTAGTEIFRVPIAIGVQKFLKLVYTVGTAAFSAGSIISSIVLDRQALGPNLGYPSGYSNQYI